LKVTKAKFEEFKVECQKWLDRFGLLDYVVFYKQAKLDDRDATVSINYQGKVCDITCSTEIEDETDIRGVAIHEVVHILLGEMSGLGCSRFCSLRELDRAEERVAMVLEKCLR